MSSLMQYVGAHLLTPINEANSDPKHLCVPASLATLSNFVGSSSTQN